MTELTPAEATRVVALLGMLSSPYDGERANAGLLVTRLIKSKGLVWSDLIRPALSYSPPPHRPAQARPASGWRAQAAQCLARSWLLSIWEIDFLDGISRQRKGLSERQQEVLARIVDRLARECRV